MLRKFSKKNEKESMFVEKYMFCEQKLLSFPHGIFEVGERTSTLKYNSPENMKQDFIAYDITMKSVMTIDTNKSDKLKPVKKPVFTRNWDFTITE